MEANLLNQYIALQLKVYEETNILLSDSQIKLIKKQIDPLKLDTSIEGNRLFLELWQKSITSVEGKSRRQKDQLLKLTEAQAKAGKALELAEARAQENERIAQEAAQLAEEAREARRQADELRVLAESKASQTEEQLKIERQTALDMQRGQKTGKIAIAAVWLSTLVTMTPAIIYIVSLLAGNPNDKALEFFKDFGLISIGGLLGLATGFIGGKSLDTGNTKTTFK